MMTYDEILLRRRFDALRKAMGWSWKDIDAITGRKNARTNITKKVPAWSRLAIWTHEAYKLTIQHHVVTIIALYLGEQWELKKLDHSFFFITKQPVPAKGVEGMDVHFVEGSFVLTSENKTLLMNLAEKLRDLYPHSTPVAKEDEFYSINVRMSITPERSLHDRFTDDFTLRPL